MHKLHSIRLVKDGCQIVLLWTATKPLSDIEIRLYYRRKQYYDLSSQRMIPSTQNDEVR